MLLFVEIVTRQRFLRGGGGGTLLENLTQDLDNTFSFQKYISGEFVGKNVVNYNEVSQVVSYTEVSQVVKKIVYAMLTEI